MNEEKLPVGTLVVREHGGQPYYEAKWRHRGKQVKRRVGKAWVKRGPDGGWVKRRGWVPDGFFDERRAHVRMAELIERYVEGQRKRAKEKADPLFEEVAYAWLEHQSLADRIKPSTLRDYQSVLAVSAPKKRGKGNAKARIMAYFAGKPVSKIDTAEVGRFLNMLDREKISTTTADKYRQVLHAIFNYAMRPETYDLPKNPVTATERRRRPAPKAIEIFTPQEIRALVAATATGRHRTPHSFEKGEAYGAEIERINHQDSVLFLVAATTGMRRGELLGLPWKNVDFEGQRIVVECAVSDGRIETTKSRRIRIVPMIEEAAEALKTLKERSRFTKRTDLVFCGIDGGILDGRSLYKRYQQAQIAAGIRPRRFHDLRHTFGSLAIRTFDLRAVQDMMGHASISTTQQYLHSRPRADDAQKLAKVFAA